MTIILFAPIESGGVLMVEDLNAIREPVAIVSSKEEALEIAEDDLLLRNPDTELCPAEYGVWSRGVTGRFVKVAVIEI